MRVYSRYGMLTRRTPLLATGTVHGADVSRLGVSAKGGKPE